MTRASPGLIKIANTNNPNNAQPDKRMYRKVFKFPNPQGFCPHLGRRGKVHKRVVEYRTVTNPHIPPHRKKTLTAVNTPAVPQKRLPTTESVGDGRPLTNAAVIATRTKAETANDMEAALLTSHSSLILLQMNDPGYKLDSLYLCSKSTGAVTSCTRKYLASAGYFRATASRHLARHPVSTSASQSHSPAPGG